MPCYGSQARRHGDRGNAAAITRGHTLVRRRTCVQLFDDKNGLGREARRRTVAAAFKELAKKRSFAFVLACSPQKTRQQSTTTLRVPVTCRRPWWLLVGASQNEQAETKQMGGKCVLVTHHLRNRMPKGDAVSRGKGGAQLCRS